jgi:ubiquinol-cytochrome c reductase subunit 7
MASFLQSLVDPRKNWLAKQHMKTLSSRLRRYGQFLLLLFKTLIIFFLLNVSYKFKELLYFFNFFNWIYLGLRYDDLYDPYYELDIKEALNRLPREIVDARNQRLKRAMDLSMKHEYLPEDLQVCYLLIYLLTANYNYIFVIKWYLSFLVFLELYFDQWYLYLDFFHIILHFL